MTRLRNCIISLFFCLPLVLNGQGWLKFYPVSPPDVLWHGPSDYTNKLATNDGGCIITGRGVSMPLSGSLVDLSVDILKVDMDGNIQWYLNYKGSNNSPPNSWTNLSGIIQTSDGGYAFTSTNNTIGRSLVKLDAFGNILYSKAIPEIARPIPVEAQDSSIVVVGVKDSVVNGIPTYFLKMQKADQQGNFYHQKIIPIQTFRTPNTSVSALSDGGFAISVINKDTTLSLVKIDINGDTLWTKVESLSSYVHSMIPNKDGGFIAPITRQIVTPTQYTEISFCYFFDSIGTFSQTPILSGYQHGTVQYPNGNLWMLVAENDTLKGYLMDSIGNILSIQELMFDVGISIFNVSLSSNNVIFIGGIGIRGFFLAAVDSTGRFILNLNEIQGNIYADTLQNCTKDNLEVSLPQSFVALKDSNQQSLQHRLTDSQGNYKFIVNEGDYHIAPVAPNLYWNPCPDIPVTIMNYDTVNVNQGLQSIFQCPKLTVDISTPFLRRCFPNTYTVYYQNKGTVIANNAYIEVMIDSFLIIDSSSIPWTTQIGNTYTFPIGDVGIWQSGRFKIYTTVDCNATLGSTHCVTAHAYPDTICSPPTNWNNANIIVDATCLVDTVEFKIKNIGIADMTQALNYDLIENDFIIRQQTYQLNAGDSLMVYKATNGSTFRLIADQVPNHPFSNRPTVAVEGCTSNSFFSTGFVNLFYEDDDAYFLSTDCQVNIGAYDPNDKRGFPQGAYSNNIIPNNRDLDYHIRFQNTGTDTAFTVVIRDTIDTNVLDLFGVKFGASSHSYEVELIGTNIFKFIFNNIMLPDSNVNESASHGFLKFRIPQQSDLPNGTQIQNSAAIYFDFNAPIITNISLHTIGELIINTTQTWQHPMIITKIFPNPFINQTIFQLEDREQRDLELQIFDAMGRIVHQEQFYNTHQFTFYNSKLTQGVYFYTLTSKGRLINRGKMMVGR